MDPGPCNKVFIRWFFNSTTSKCERFVYGGCNGNGNNFISFNDCDSNCKEELALELKNAAALIANDAPDTGFKVDEETKKTTLEKEVVAPKNATLVEGLNCAPIGVCPAPECALLKLHDSMCETCFCTTEPGKKTEKLSNDTTAGTTITKNTVTGTTTTTKDEDKLTVGTNCPPVVNCVKTGCSTVRLRGGCEACYCLPQPTEKKEEVKTTEKPIIGDEMKTTKKPITTGDEATVKPIIKEEQKTTLKPLAKEELKTSTKPLTQDEMKTTEKHKSTEKLTTKEEMKPTLKTLTTMKPKSMEKIEPAKDTKKTVGTVATVVTTDQKTVTV